MGALRARSLRRSKVERLRDRGDVKRLLRRLNYHDWIVDRDGVAHDLGVGRRLDVVAALGAINDERAEAGVVLALGDEHPRVRHAAVEALRPVPSTEAAQALARAAASWRDPSLEPARAAAVDLLVELGDARLAVAYAETVVDDAEREELSGQDREALRLLFPLEGDPVALAFVARLAERLATSDDRELRRVQEALAAIGGIAVGPLIRALDDIPRQQGACAALATIRDTRATPALLGVLVTADAASRAMAAQALGNIRDPRAVDGLIRASNDRDPEVRDSAIDALDRMRSVVGALDPPVGKHDGVPGSGIWERGASRADRPANGHNHLARLRRLLGR